MFCPRCGKATDSEHKVLPKLRCSSGRRGRCTSRSRAGRTMDPARCYTAGCRPGGRLSGRVYGRVRRASGHGAHDVPVLSRRSATGVLRPGGARRTRGCSRSSGRTDGKHPGKDPGPGLDRQAGGIQLKGRLFQRDFHQARARKRWRNTSRWARREPRRRSRWWTPTGPSPGCSSACSRGLVLAYAAIYASVPLYPE